MKARRSKTSGSDQQEAERRFSIDLRRSDQGVVVTRRSTSYGKSVEVVVVVRSLEEFEVMRDGDPMRFDHAHEFEQAARRLRHLLREAKA